MLGIGGSPLGASADGRVSLGVSGGAAARISLGAQRRKFSSSWIDAAFTPREHRSPAQSARLAESDQLVAELLAADLLVIGAPMYNFGLPSQLKAWIDNIVRVGGPSVSIDRAMASHIGRCCRAANGLSSCLRAGITVMIRVGAWRQ